MYIYKAKTRIYVKSDPSMAHSRTIQLEAGMYHVFKEEPRFPPHVKARFDIMKVEEVKENKPLEVVEKAQKKKAKKKAEAKSELEDAGIIL